MIGIMADADSARVWARHSDGHRPAHQPPARQQQQQLIQRQHAPHAPHLATNHDSPGLELSLGSCAPSSCSAASEGRLLLPLLPLLPLPLPPPLLLLLPLVALVDTNTPLKSA